MSPADIAAIKTELNNYARKTDLTDIKGDVAKNYLSKVDYTSQSAGYAKVDQLTNYIQQTDLDGKLTNYLKGDPASVENALRPKTMWCAAGGDICDVPPTKSANFPLDVSVGRNFLTTGAGTFGSINTTGEAKFGTLEATGTTNLKDTKVTGKFWAPNVYPVDTVSGNNGTVTCTKYCNGSWGKSQLDNRYPGYKGAISTLANRDAQRDGLCECQMSNFWAWETLG